MGGGGWVCAQIAVLIVAFLANIQYDISSSVSLYDLEEDRIE
jgi:hypothetical protein